MARFERKAQSQPKHGPPSSSGASKAPRALPTQRPGWKGPGYVKKVVRQKPAPAQAQTAGPPVQEQIIPEDLQQLILDIFRDAFPASNDFETLKPALREIKDAVAQREFDRAFGTEERLELYTIRWSPSKALACSNILAWICREWEDLEWTDRFIGGDEPAKGKILNFGRGAAGFMASVTMLKHHHPNAAGQRGQSIPENAVEVPKSLDNLAIAEPQSASASPLLSIRLVDTVNWSNVISKLHHSLTTPPPLSQYASAKARASNSSLLSQQALNWTFSQLDILDCGIEDLRSMIGADPTLLTLFFSLSELYSTSISKASAFLLRLTAAAPQGSLLLVVDDPGATVESRVPSDSETQEKRYPMHWLMYQVLLPPKTRKAEKNEEQNEALWEKLAEEDETLFQIAKGLRFPASLENIRFQMHLLRRL